MKGEQVGEGKEKGGGGRREKGREEKERRKRNRVKEVPVAKEDYSDVYITVKSHSLHSPAY